MATTPTQDATFVAALQVWLAAGAGNSTTAQDNTFYKAGQTWLSQRSAHAPVPHVAPATFTVAQGYGLDSLVGTLTSDIPCTGLVITGDPNHFFAAYASTMNLRTSTSKVVPPAAYTISVAGQNASGLGPAAQIGITMQAAASPPPPPPPPSTGWPDASNTGVPSGITLTPSSDLTLTTAGAVIDSLDIAGTIEVAASNVTIKNCKVHGIGWYQIHIQQGVTGTVVQNCTLDAGGTGFNSMALACIADEGGNSKFIGNSLMNFEHGISLINGGGNGDLIQGNYIHDFNAPASLQPHYDGIEINGTEANIQILGNTIINKQDNSCIMIDNYFGSIDNIQVDGNLVVGGTYNIFCDAQFNSNPITNVSITNNHYGTSTYGFTAINKNNPTVSGNVNDGDAIAATLKQ